MYVRSLRIENIRSIANLTLEFKEPFEGWHVVLGDNGSGKSSLIRALSLALIGPAEALATRQDWTKWVYGKFREGIVEAEILQDDAFDKWSGKGRQAKKPLKIFARFPKNGKGSSGGEPIFEKGNTKANGRTIWGSGSGWFSAAFGPFRRFSGGDKEYDRLFHTNPGLARHLSAFGEGAALGEALRWMRDLQFKSYENDEEARRLLEGLKKFMSQLQLPHDSQFTEINSEAVVVRDGGGAPVAVENLSDGFQSVLSMTFELLRGMVASYGREEFLDALDSGNGIVKLPGIVAIDEVDAHLHPAWQTRIGDWLIERFPRVQFIVTTHSPIICRSAEKGSIWRLPTPGSDDEARQIIGQDRVRLFHGSVLDAYDTELFGKK